MHNAAVNSAGASLQLAVRVFARVQDQLMTLACFFFLSLHAHLAMAHGQHMHLNDNEARNTLIFLFLGLFGSFLALLRQHKRSGPWLKKSFSWSRTPRRVKFLFSLSYLTLIDAINHLIVTMNLWKGPKADVVGFRIATLFTIATLLPLSTVTVCERYSRALANHQVS